MSSARFQTVPTELVEHAESAYSYFRQRGFTVRREVTDLSFPSCPTLLCRRQATTLVVNVCGRIVLPGVRDWVALARAKGTDFRIAVWIAPESQLKHLPRVQVELTQLGVGVFVSSVPVVTLVEPTDQNPPKGLPDLASRKVAVRRQLGAAFDHFNAQRWKEGFDEACRVLEQLALAHILKALKSTRLTLYDSKGQPQAANLQKIKKQPIGAQIKTLEAARPHSATDALILRVLKQINDDRIKITHRNKSAATDKSLRRNATLHMHVILHAVDALCA
jgi:hypothetical protein